MHIFCVNFVGQLNLKFRVPSVSIYLRWMYEMLGYMADSSIVHPVIHSSLTLLRPYTMYQVSSQSMGRLLLVVAENIVQTRYVLLSRVSEIYQNI